MALLACTTIGRQEAISLRHLRTCPPKWREESKNSAASWEELAQGGQGQVDRHRPRRIWLQDSRHTHLGLGPLLLRRRRRQQSTITSSRCLLRLNEDGSR